MFLTTRSLGCAGVQRGQSARPSSAFNAGVPSFLQRIPASCTLTDVSRRSWFACWRSIYCKGRTFSSARDHLQRFSVLPIRDEVVRRELRRLGYTNKKVRQRRSIGGGGRAIFCLPCPLMSVPCACCRRTATARREILQRRLITVTSAEGSSRGLSWSS